MAQKVKVELIDDLDGTEADETIQFGLDGKNFEIDLTTENADKLRKALQEFVGAARKAQNKPARGSTRQAKRQGPDRERSAEIRAWAKQQGKQVNERGRIPATIVAEYEAATGR
ncbi:histone-like nucleoid-structuring protein Lsr2 [Nocardiopsis suaedae]|uniref:Lsr2 family protein n=1 Tax=Nocardiopsis suaedae TaxID=3018444 RepID=A0ABT4THJ6_9ACTN|nr:Lsr2 family protein [Nocardiopsis suaedae]MDA2804061.1 Lsr2 family protein [Nocardiopsis suaedae]